jgi:glutamine---fructose-6-phosphate transaminase (isomerizing)
MDVALASGLSPVAARPRMDELPPPEAVHPPDDRHRHPFHLHEMIRRQPIAATTTLTAIRAAAIPELPKRGRVLFTGIGTAFHAALGMARAAHETAPDPLRLAVAVPAFELRGSPPGLDDVSLGVVVSASGATDVTRRALEALKGRGVPTLLLTASERAPMRELASHTFVTQYADELSWTHSVSYSASLVAAHGILARWTNATPERWAVLEGLADDLNASLAYEPKAVDLAERWADRGRWVLLGTGPRNVTVREAALKLREAAGKFVTPLGVEEFLHGSLSSVDDGCVVIALAGTPLEAARAREGLEAAGKLGAETLLLDSTPGATGPDAWSYRPLPGALSCVTDIGPFQFLAYWMAVSLGRNPDMMGYDDPRYRAARSGFGL